MAKIPTEFDPRRLPDIIRRPLLNEKATRQLESNKYTFDVFHNATKPEIRAAIESLFSVTVTKVNTHNPPAQARRIGKFAGKRAQIKRAIVTLAEGSKINLFPDV